MHKAHVRLVPEADILPSVRNRCRAARNRSFIGVEVGAGTTEQSYYRWRKEYGGLGVDQAKRFKQLEDENSRLKKLVGHLHLSQSNRLQPLSTRHTTCNNLSLRLVQNIGQANDRELPWLPTTNPCMDKLGGQPELRTCSYRCSIERARRRYGGHRGVACRASSQDTGVWTFLYRSQLH